MPTLYYQGIYKPINPEKYTGNVKDIVYRSLWERYTFRWIDKNPDIVKWSSEEIIVHYLIGNRMRRYFPDLLFERKNGDRIMVEIKPERHTKKPKFPGKKTKQYLWESKQYITNMHKWEAAKTYCDTHGIEFQVWDRKDTERIEDIA